jgi:IS5 family transposase
MRGQPGFSDVERAEFLINDRISFMRLPGPVLADRVPDARTIWLFREKLTKARAIEGLFARFDAALRASGYIAMSGQIVDATLVAAPKQRNSVDEKKAIKEGRALLGARRCLRFHIWLLCEPPLSGFHNGGCRGLVTRAVRKRWATFVLAFYP